MNDVIEYIKENSVETLCVVLFLALSFCLFIIEHLYAEIDNKNMAIRDLETILKLKRHGKI